MTHATNFLTISPLDAPEPPMLRPGLKERAVLFEVVKVSETGERLAPAVETVTVARHATARRRPTDHLANATTLALVGMVSGGTGAVASAAGIAIGVLLGSLLLSPATPDVHHVVAANSWASPSLSSALVNHTVASRVEVIDANDIEDVEDVEADAVSVAEVLSPAVVASSETHHDAVASVDELDFLDDDDVWSVPPTFEATLPEPPPPLRLAAAAPVSHTSAAEAPDDRRKLADRLGIRKRR